MNAPWVLIIAMNMQFAQIQKEVSNAYALFFWKGMASNVKTLKHLPANHLSLLSEESDASISSKKKQNYERSRESCKDIGGDLFVAINPEQYLRLAQHFINTNQAATQKYMWVGVVEGVWLNGRKVAAKEEAPGNPTMGSGTCSYTDGDLNEKFLLWTDPCFRWFWALCERNTSVFKV
ncbi:uncharacterized protein [Palaemon carinicauda]|uniref:uncharacterized protein n=1 Tax=Palaemon carinicauda TaxID=392227 RepID=UPI0035B65D22